MTATIYVFLLDEGTDVWRPVHAEHISGDTYQIVDIEPGDDENWEFKSGETVRVRDKVFSGGETGLVAYERVSAGATK